MHQIWSLYLYSFWRYVWCTPKIMMVTWPRPRPFSGLFFAGFWDIAPRHLYAKLQVSSSTRFEYTLGGTPKFLVVTWPRPRPFSEFIFAGFWDIATLHLSTKFQVSTSTRFWDTLGCTKKIMMVTWPRPRPFSGFFFAVFEILPLRTCLPYFNSLALLILNIR